MPANDVESLNQALAGLTSVSSMLFESEADGFCRLTLILGRESALVAGASEIVCFSFNGVSNLKVADFGGGLTQVMCLRCKDVRGQQLDRINFELEDLEDGKLFFLCRSFEIGS